LCAKRQGNLAWRVCLQLSAARQAPKCCLASNRKATPRATLGTNRCRSEGSWPCDGRLLSGRRILSSVRCHQLERSIIRAEAQASFLSLIESGPRRQDRSDRSARGRARFCRSPSSCRHRYSEGSGTGFAGAAGARSWLSRRPALGVRATLDCNLVHTIERIRRLFEITIDARLKSEGAPERSPIAGEGAPSGVDAGAKRYSVQRKMAVAFVAWRTVGCRRPGSECLCGQADRIAGPSTRRRGVSASATIARTKSPD
jgi:hypothetical protein